MAAQSGHKRTRLPSTSSTHSNPSDHSQDTEARLSDALQALRSGTSPSLRQATRDHQVSYATLWNRAHGINNRSTAHEHEQLLSNVQQKVLIEWCEYHAHMSIPLTHIQVSYLQFVFYSLTHMCTGSPEGS